MDERWRKGVGRKETEKYRGPKTFRQEWPSSGAVLLHDGRVPEVGEVARNPDLARTFRRLARAEKEALKKGGDRKSGLRAVHDYFYKGPIAQELVKFSREFKVRDREGGYNHGLLTADDFADYEARIQEPGASITGDIRSTSADPGPRARYSFSSWPCWKATISPPWGTTPPTTSISGWRRRSWPTPTRRSITAIPTSYTSPARVCFPRNTPS